MPIVREKLRSVVFDAGLRGRKGPSVVEAIAFAAGEPGSRNPTCVSPTIGRLLSRAGFAPVWWTASCTGDNIAATEALMPFVLRLSELPPPTEAGELRIAFALADLVLREFLPSQMSQRSILGQWHGRKFRSLPPLVDHLTAARAREVAWADARPYTVFCELLLTLEELIYRAKRCEGLLSGADSFRSALECYASPAVAEAQREYEAVLDAEEDGELTPSHISQRNDANVAKEGYLHDYLTFADATYSFTYSFVDAEADRGPSRSADHYAFFTRNPGGISGRVVYDSACRRTFVNYFSILMERALGAALQGK